MENILDIVDNYIVVIDKKYNIQFCNKKMLLKLEYNLEELKNFNIRKILYTKNEIQEINIENIIKKQQIKNEFRIVL